MSPPASAAPISEVDITALLQPRQGYLWKLGGGGETGSKWNRRWFVLRDNVLMYFAAPRDFFGFRDKPSGVVLLDECRRGAAASPRRARRAAPPHLGPHDPPAPPPS